jgi:K+-transporting ATPase ATPase C chain
MRSMLRASLTTLILLSVLTGLAYPLLVAGIGQLFFPRQANGSLVEANGRVVGSRLIGQAFDDPKYFWGRPSATTPFPYNTQSSGGSNLGPLNPALQKAVQARIDALRQADPGNAKPPPVDLVTASGSGLDPDISPAAALYQAARVARVRNLDPAVVRSLLDQCTAPRQIGVLGEPRVNVLLLNRALDALTKTD